MGCFRVLSSTEQQLRCFKLQALCSYKYILIFLIINVQQDDCFFLPIVKENYSKKLTP